MLPHDLSLDNGVIYGDIALPVKVAIFQPLGQLATAVPDAAGNLKWR